MFGRIRRIALCVLFFGLASVPGLQAAVKIPALLNNNMVLQRDKPVTIWGWADPAEEVAVYFAGQTVRTQADAKGNWEVQLQPLSASEEEREMRIEGKNTITLKNIVVGDVWLCSGQSNMARQVKTALNAGKEIEASADPLLRHAQIYNWELNDAPQEDVGTTGNWALSSPKTTGEFTATGYFFARKIRAETKIPIGLINDSWGGTNIETWISGEAYRSIPGATFHGIKDIVASLKALDARLPEGKKAYEEQLAKIKLWLPQAEAAVSAGEYPSQMPKLPNMGNSNDSTLPARIFNTHIHPIRKFAIKGVLWYQGESNATFGLESESYTLKMEALVSGWRALWKDEWPFYYVQLPNFNPVTHDPAGGSGNASLREAQLKALRIPRSGMAIAIDIGEENDIHPRNKQDVGLRLALLALTKDYGKTGLVGSGPLYRDYRIENGAIRIRFTEADSGLMVGEKQGLEPVRPMPDKSLQWIAIAGADKRWVWAEGKIEGDTLLVSSPQVKEPVAVRYAFRQNPAGRLLYNKGGLPASPFRTDNW